MVLNELIKQYKEQFDIVDVINLNECLTQPSYYIWLKKKLLGIFKEEYNPNERILFYLTVDNANAHLIFKMLAYILNKDIDISNFFFVVACNNNLEKYKDALESNTNDTVPVKFVQIDDVVETINTNENNDNMAYGYNSWTPVKTSELELTDFDISLLRDSKTFCIYPWIHLHAYPTGDAWPCCGAEMKAGPCGNTHDNTLKELWNSDKMKELRTNMLAGKKNELCSRCYEQDEHGFFSMRKSANKHHGHHIGRVQDTQPDGTYDNFHMTYIDVRFSNLCNLSCRSCGHIFSSSWFKDQVALNPGYEKDHKALNIAGRFENDLLEQILEHIDYVEQIYFAGGEPLMMEEHYIILEELVKRKRFNVRLIYNTNFTRTNLKGKSVFEYWKLFDSVSVGASLDAMGERAEYLRKGTKWADVEQNRKNMMRICPDVDFYISSTLSIFNSLHIVDFHRDWVEKGFIKPQDFNVNILQDPAEYRIDIAPKDLKNRIIKKYEEHLEWLRDNDELNRASTGFESAIKYIQNNNEFLVDPFLHKTKQLDNIRNENLYTVFPELAGIDVL